MYQDTDGDGVPDKLDNCPMVATSDFTDSDGDGIGNACDKSPDGIEPDPGPLPTLNGSKPDDVSEPTAPDSGAGQDGQAISLDSPTRAKERERTSYERPIITTGAPSEGDATAVALVGGAPDQSQAVITLATEASEDVNVDDGHATLPETGQGAIPDNARQSSAAWITIVRIDAGATVTTPGRTATPDAVTSDVEKSRFVHGWLRAKLFLQGSLAEDVSVVEGQSSEEAAGDPASQAHPSRVPVPVEHGLVITGVDRGDAGDVDGSRRDGSWQGPAREMTAPSLATDGSDQQRAPRHQSRTTGHSQTATDGWAPDRFFAGGSALNWSDTLAIAGTDEPDLYRTQRSGSGPGKRGSFSYAIPVPENGVYLVRLSFAEPYWGAPGGPENAVGQRVFSVTAEGTTQIEALDIAAEAGPLTALIKEFPVDVDDGELNLRFTASAGAPMVAAIEVLQSDASPTADN